MGDSERSRRHTWTTRRDRRKSGGGTGRSGIQGEHGNIEKDAKKIQEDLTRPMQKNLRKIQGNLEEVQEDLECKEIQNKEIQRDLRKILGEIQKDPGHTWTTRRDRRKSGGSTGRSEIQGKHGNIEKEGKKIQEDPGDIHGRLEDTGRSGIQGEHGNIENEPKKTQEDLT
jgi:hypothetical protein